MKIYEYDNYKTYLNGLVGPQKRRTGLKSKMSQEIGCQSGYLSKVLNHHAHLSLEQGEKLNMLLAHNKNEAHYFLLLIQYERAATENLKTYFKEQLEQLKKDHLTLHRRVDIKYQLRPEDQSRYYSSWHYGAIHMAITLEKLRTIDDLSKHFQLPVSKVNEVLNFLQEILLIEKVENHFVVTNNNIYLEKNSPLISKHHTNWRMRAIDSLDYESSFDLHYSGLITISKKDAEKIKEGMIQFLQKSLKIVEKSKEEDLYCLNLDFFQS